MPDNSVVRHYLEHHDFTPELTRALQIVSSEIGFLPEEELDRRTIYDASKVWRVRIKGTWNGAPAVLRLENIKLEQDEEGIRAAFRAQLPPQAGIRPPKTYLHAAFDEAKGYGYSLDELVEGDILFDPAIDPATAAKKFTTFYRALRTAVSTSFWPAPSLDAATFTIKQMRESWLRVANEKDPEWVTRYAPHIEPLIDLIATHLAQQPLVFMHAHLAGTDVRVNRAGEYIVFANHLWSFRQPGYDLSFPTWGQWLALQKGERTTAGVQNVTRAWEEEIATSLSDLVSIDEWRLMLLNRIFGAILLDIPAIARKPGESEQTVQPLVDALLQEAERIKGMIT